jgi:membrane fusion protein (multidrug efflux system)
MRVLLLTAFLALGLGAHVSPARAQFGGGPPAVGVVKAEKRAVTESREFVGRVQSIDKVDLIARVTAFIEEIRFVEGAEVRKGDLLYRLERGPFEADLANKQAAVAQFTALHRNATITLGRAQSLLNTPAGQRSTVDDAIANQANYAAQTQAAEAQVRASQINLDYTEIKAPIAGKITRTAVTVGNVVSPTSGVLASIYSQDPMYVLFPVSVRTVLELRAHYADKGGANALAIRLRLPDGTMYKEVGKLDYIDPSVATGTDTLTLRARIPNPVRAGGTPGDLASRDLVDSEFVTVRVEGVEPVQALAIPRIAVLSDQQGNFVYVVNAENKAEQRRIVLGQSTPTEAVIQSGLQEGDSVIVDGLQKVRPGAPVVPSPFGAPPAAAPAAAGAAPAKG